jgi:hypothetical protein
MRITKRLLGSSLREDCLTYQSNLQMIISDSRSLLKVARKRYPFKENRHQLALVSQDREYHLCSLMQAKGAA